MNIDQNKTYIEYTKEKKWYLIDANSENLGRLSSKITSFLLGKNQKIYTPHIMNNIKIIIINTKLIKVTGNKEKQKIYRKHSGRPGGLKVETFHSLQQKLPNRILEISIKGMLPKNKLGKKLFNQVKMYPSNNHPHSVQQPILIKLNKI
uniref:Large ribosomal subunit protein uL13c n=1 Tax=Taenioma perpusillum TaxID=210852 RepID=A0A1Z1MR38_9FLOR|nr:ribosomal protein L13 [Taenioma perpusillum]ARW68563.1 ribosomal protein L13 [Taenioma perpusillum]